MTVRDRLTYGPHTFPIGEALRRALVDVEDLRAWLRSSRKMAVIVSDAADEPLPKRVPAQRAQEEAILMVLRKKGFDPEALPKAPAGKTSPAKQAAREALQYSDAVLDKAWIRLRKEGQIKDA